MKNIEILKCRKLDNYHSNDFFSELFARAKKSVVKTLTGIPPLTFTADGTPLLDYLITGNTTQSGTPTPDNPVMPQGTGERTGNLYFKKLVGANISDGGVITTLTGFDLYIAKVEQGVYYSGRGYIYAFFEDEPTIGSISFNGSRVVSSLNNIVSPINGYVAVRNPNDIQNAMCNIGNAVLPYEPYGYKIPISSANTTTPVYLGEVETTRRIKKLVLTGQEYYTESTYWKGAETSAYYTDATGIDSADKNNIVTISSHFKGVTRDTAAYNDIPCVASSNRYAIFRIETATASTPAEFKQWLAQQYAAGTPVTVWYVLANEETGIVNEPLMKIGNYADTVSKEQAGVSIPTNNGSTTVDVDTTVKPSEVYIKYMG